MWAVQQSVSAAKAARHPQEGLLQRLRPSARPGQGVAGEAGAAEHLSCTENVSEARKASQ